MMYPCLVPKIVCKTPISIHIESEELTVEGDPKYVKDIECLCNWQDHAKTVLTTEKKLIEVNGTALIPGDIAPDIPAISGGMVQIFGQERRIVSGRKNRNPDGTVNYCTIEVI
jgi:hypothetical protein